MNLESYVFLGDSLTFGYGIKKELSWVYKISTNLNVNVINKGINGNTTTDMLCRFTEDVIKLSPDNVFIMGGTNDLLSNRSIDSIIHNLKLMIKEALLNNINVIIGIPPIIIPDDACRLFYPTNTYKYCFDQLYNLSKSIPILCKEYNIKYIDFYTISKDNIKNNIFIDGIHFNEKGNNLLYETFIKKI